MVDNYTMDKTDADKRAYEKKLMAVHVALQQSMEAEKRRQEQKQQAENDAATKQLVNFLKKNMK